jgi:hypothetical protein
MEVVACCQRENMAKIKKILCLGNHTEDTDAQSADWAEKFGLPYRGLLSTTSVDHTGVFVPDLSCLSMDDIWELTGWVDLVIMLDQPVESFDFVETYQHFISLCRYKKYRMPVLIGAVDTPLIWLEQLTDNSQAVPTIVDLDLHNSNVIIKLNTVDNIDLFETQLITLATELKQRMCKWIMYRASPHEPLHFQATQALLNYPEFVLLNPAVFCGNVATNIKQRIYHHWVDLYCKETL